MHTLNKFLCIIFYIADLNIGIAYKIAASIYAHNVKGNKKHFNDQNEIDLKNQQGNIIDQVTPNQVHISLNVFNFKFNGPDSLTVKSTRLNCLDFYLFSFYFNNFENII